MTRGKQTCKILKEIRRQIAEANGIEFVTSECRYKGNCLGTCPKCEAEVRYLEQQLRARSLAGKAVALAGISAASLAMLLPISTEAQVPADIRILPTDSIAMTSVDSVKVKGIARYEFENKVDSIASEELIGATVLNLTNGKGTITDIDGKFEIDAQVGDTIEVSYVGFKSKTVTVTDIAQPIAVTLDMKVVLVGELPVVKRKILQSHTIELFAYDGIDVNKSNVDFAILTHHKNIFQPAIGAPILTLGTVIKSVDKYYVCIQQRCDSVRIKEERRFLFLPLEEKGEYPLIVNNELKLFPNKSSFAIKTVKFKPKEGATIIQASKKEDKYVFYSSYGETYEWVVDLKEMQAQRILNSYCAQLSRVGLNESEWLRLIAKQ